MKFNNKTNCLPLIAAVLGLIALILRLGLFALGMDQKGLLIPGHPLDILVWIFTAAAVLLAATVLPQKTDAADDSDDFRLFAPAAIGAFALAGGITLSVLTGWDAWTRLEQLRNLTGIAAIPALVLAGLARFQGKQPFFGFHALVCLHLTLRTISHYQIWCSSPQLQTYLFSMAASILLFLFAYYQTASDADLGNPRLRRFTGLLGSFFCLAAAADGADILLYLGGALWMLTNLGRFAPARPTGKMSVGKGEPADDHEPA